MSVSKPDTIRVLALDGGGIRGLSSLIILRDLMQRIAVKIHSPTALRPCDYFELIIGTGTGGISALFIGRMRMTVDEAIDAYLLMAREGFRRSTAPLVQRLWNAQTLFDGDSFTHIIGEIAQKALGDRDAQMQDEVILSAGEGVTSCRTAVLASTSANVSDPPHIFRSYSTSHPASTFTIHQVARATVSTAGIFPPISIGNPATNFIGADVAGFNNPSEISLQEVTQIWPDAEITCLVSLGTGLQNVVRVDDSWEAVMNISRRLMEDCEQVNYRLMQRKHSEVLPYFRFNVTRELDRVGIREWDDETSGITTAITAGYMRQPDVDDSLNSCIATMLGQKYGIPVGQGIRSSEAGPFLPLLNPAPEIFHGREEYLELAISIIILNNPSRLAILGPGGIGKTSIALHLLHDRRIGAYYGEHRRFISCEGIQSVTALIDAFCEAFDISGFSDRRRGLMDFLTHTFNREPLLVVIDNFETIWDVSGGRREAEFFLSTLATVPRLALIVTMRGSELPSGIRWTHPRPPVVVPLSPKAARDAFLDNGAQEDEHLDTLLQKVDHIPLAVTLLAKLGRNDSPFVLLQRWDAEQVRLLSRPRDEDRLENLEVSILLSLQSPRMLSAPGALSLLSGISLLPSGVFDGDLLAMFPSVPDLNLAAATLIDVSLAYYDKARTLKVLSPIRLYILQYHRVLHGSRLLQDLESFFCEFVKQGWLNPGNHGYENSVTALSRQTTNVDYVLTQALREGRAEENGRIIKAALDWTNFLIWNRPGTHIINLAIQLSLRSDARQHLAECLFKLGRMHRLLGDADTAIEMLRKAEKEFEAKGNPFRAAYCLWDIGESLRSLERYDDAQKILWDAIPRYEFFGRRGARADCLWSLGEIQRALGDPKGARDLLTESQEIFEKKGSRRGVADCLWSLGCISLDLHEYKASRSTLTRALNHFEALRMTKRTADCQWMLGRVQCFLHEYESARDLFTEAREGYKKFGDIENSAFCDEALVRIQ